MIIGFGGKLLMIRRLVKVAADKRVKDGGDC